MIAMETDLPYLSREKDRHDNERLYVRRHGKRRRIRAAEGTPDFAKHYSEALDSLELPAEIDQRKAVEASQKGTFRWLGTLYFGSKGDGEFLKLAKESRRARRNDLEECFRYPFADDDPDPTGNCPLRYLSAQKMKRLIEAKEGDGAQANRRKHLSALCAWGVENKHLSSNPVRDIKAGTAQQKKKGGGYYTWTIPDVQQFLERHGVGTKGRLAMSLLLFSGARRQDMVTLGKQNCRGTRPDVLGDWIRYIPKKTLYKRRDVSQKPLLPVLKEVIATSPCGLLTFLETAQGKPFTAAGFGNWFRERCDEAGLPMCTAHGLKKAGATIAAENGATTRQLMAMFDWSTASMAETYTKAAEQKKLAGEAMFLISLDRKQNDDCLTLEVPRTGTVSP